MHKPLASRTCFLPSHVPGINTLLKEQGMFKIASQLKKKCFTGSTDEEEDDEEVYKMAGVMAQCGGLECMLNRLSGIKDFKQGRHLLTVS